MTKKKVTKQPEVLEGELIPTESRPMYRYVCTKQHHILEAFYIGERVLIAPESCNDYLTNVYNLGGAKSLQLMASRPFAGICVQKIELKVGGVLEK